jgi:uncharacterized protein YoxC
MPNDQDEPGAVGSPSPNPTEELHPPPAGDGATGAREAADAATPPADTDDTTPGDAAAEGPPPMPTAPPARRPPDLTEEILATPPVVDPATDTPPLSPPDLAAQPPSATEAATFGGEGPPEPLAHSTGWWVGVSVAAVLALGLALLGGYLWGSTTSDQSDLEAQLSQANDKVASLQQQVDDLTAQQQDLQDQIDQLQSENQDLQGQVQDLTQERDDLTQQLDDAQSQLQDVQDQLDTANAQLQALLGASPGDGPASVGGALLIHGQGDQALNTTLVVVVDPASGQATPGNRLVAVALQLANVGSGAVDGSFGDGVTLTADGTDYSPVAGGPEPDLRNVSLEPGASTGGYLTFEIPESAGLQTLEITLDGGSGPETGTWDLG